MSNITLVIVPGPGARTVSITSNVTTISDIVNNENLSNRDIIVNGEAIPRNSWNTYTLTSNSEVFATASVKGNGKNTPANGPSQTGRPSGGGRGNNTPRRN